MNNAILMGADIHVVDDDESVCEALKAALCLFGCNVRVFNNGDSFLAAALVRAPACVLLDIELPGQSGLDILRTLMSQGVDAPVLMISARSDVPKVVQAIKGGATDFIEKPFDLDAIVERVSKAISLVLRRKEAHANDALPWFPGRDTLTPREYEVLVEIASGASNKTAARTLGISPRTVEVHRARIREKLGARNAVELMHIVIGANGRHGNNNGSMQSSRDWQVNGFQRANGHSREVS